MIINISLQIPDPGLAMAEEERSSKGTKRRREDSGESATEGDPLAQGVILIDSGDEDPHPDQVSSFLGDFRLL